MGRFRGDEFSSGDTREARQGGENGRADNRRQKSDLNKAIVEVHRGPWYLIRAGVA